MKKIIFLLLVIILSTSSISSFATSSTQLGTLSSSISTSTPGGTGLVIDDSLVNAVEQQSQTDLLKELQDAKNSITLTKAKSCEDFDSVLTKWIEKNKEYFSQWWWGYYGRPMPIDGVAVMEDSTSATAISAKQLDGVWGAWSPDFSATNVQKAWIDEPDIIKNDGQYIYYVNNAKKLLYILKWPYNWTTLDMGLVNVVKVIRLPKTYNTSDLLIQGNKLVLVATRYLDRPWNSNTSFYDRNARVSVVVFDTTDKTKPTIARLLDFAGQLQDSRLTNGKLYIVSNLYFNRGPIYWIMNEKKQLDDIISPASLIPSWVEAVRKITGKLDKHVIKPDCSTIEYVLPEKPQDFSPNVWIIHAIDIVSDANAHTSMFYGNAWQIHLSSKSLYIVSPISLWNYPTPCPINARCIMPLIWRVPDNFSMIHKYTLNEGKPFYSDTAVVKGDLLNQYSMDEDDKGNFRILTRNRNPQLATHVWKLNSSLQHDSQLLNIEPGEDFKASRYIGDKLYLVTFQQIDPLFVIDMATKPTILGELKIPWFSQYLHPYSPLTNGKQLLIGLGVDTQEKDGRVTTNGLKLDLYEINYNQKDANGSISIKQLHTKTIWWKGSWSESLENPRTFVYNEKTKKLLLPMIAQDEIEKKTCQKDYYGQEYCYPTMSYNTTFAGLKTFMLDTTSGITELASKDYKDQIISYLKANNQYYGSEWNNFGLDQRQYMWLWNRAWYIGDTSYFINNAFADFITSKETKMIKF